MKKIVIMGWYGHNNLGDEIILDSMLDNLRSTLKSQELYFTVLSSFPCKVSQWHQVNSINYSRRIKYHWAVIQAIKEADLLILGGGGYLFDGPETRFPLEIIYFLLPAITAGILRKRVATYAVGLGPIYSQIGKFITRLVFNRISVITVRDANSKTLLQTIGVNKPEIRVTADPAILIRTPANLPLKTCEISSNINPYCVLCPASLHLLSLQKLTREKRRSIIELLAHVSDYIISELKVDLVLMPMQISDHEDDDCVVVSDIFNKMKYKNKARVVTDSPIYERVGILQNAQLVMGMRMHSLITAAAAHVPVIGIAHTPKIKDFLAQIGYENCCIDVDNLEFNRVTELINDVWERRTDIIQHLETVIPENRKQAAFNAELIRDILSEPQ
jgi:L-malate glycosyltransferase